MASSVSIGLFIALPSPYRVLEEPLIHLQYDNYIITGE